MAKRLAVAKNDRELPPPKIAWRPYYTWTSKVYIVFFREIGMPKFAHNLQPELLRIHQSDREWTPPKIARGSIINWVFLSVINCVTNWSLMVINAGTGQTVVGRSEKRTKQKSSLTIPRSHGGANGMGRISNSCTLGLKFKLLSV